MTEQTQSELLYHNIENDLRQKILSGEYGPGEKLPTEAEFCKMYSVSRITVRRAIQNLVDDNMLCRYRGKGTFVRQPVHEYDDTHENNMGFGSLLAQDASSRRKVVAAERMPASDYIAERLAIPVGNEIQLVRRVAYADNVPLILDNVYVSSEYLPNLVDDLKEDISLYDLLEGTYKLKLARADQRMNAVSATKEDAELLECLPGAALLHVEKIVTDTTGRPVHFSITNLVGDRTISKFSFDRKRTRIEH